MIKKLQIVLASLILVCSFLSARAQNHSFNKILTQEGEANLSVREIFQDDNGFLWLATFSGLYRYEGDDYIVEYNFNNNVKVNADVTALAQDKERNIWIGTNKGLSKFNPVTEELLTYEHDAEDSLSIGDDKIRCIDVDDEGRIWIGTREGGLCLYLPEVDGFETIKIEGKGIVNPGYVKSLLTASDGKIWIGTWQNGVYCLSVSGKKVDVICNYRAEDPVNNLSHNYVYCLYEDSDGKIIAGTRNGLNVFDPKTKKMRSYRTNPDYSRGMMTNFFRSVRRNKDGKLWISTWGGLILCEGFSDLESGNFELLVHDRRNMHSISHNQVMDVLEDKSGSIWIGTENGLNNYDPYQNQFQPLGGGAIDKFTEQTATAFSSYKNGMLILTLSHGIIFQNEAGSTFFPESNGFEKYNEKLYTLLVDSKNNIWAGSYNGYLIRMDAKTKQLKRFKHSKKQIPIYALLESENGSILLGTNGEGLKYFNPQTEKFTSHSGLSGSVDINDILIDKDNNTWITSQLGIFKRSANSQTFEYYLPDNNKGLVTPNIFNVVAESEDGEILVGGRNGLYRYNSEANDFENIDLEGAERIWVTNIQFDSEHNLWLNLNFNRIAKCDVENRKLELFKVNNGIRSSQYNRRGFYIDKHNQLYVSGFDQIYKFQTFVSVENNYAPSPVFSSLTINNTKVNVGTQINNQVILNKNIAYQENLALNHDNKDFTLSFISTSYLNKSDNRYRFMLHGYDNEWSEGNQQQAHYTNLSPGRYTFEVYTANNDGLWCDEPALLAIRIKPPPFLSIWAILLYFVVIAIVVYQIRRVILARLGLKQELLIERVKRDKEETFHQERLRFYTNISHELRTPLTLIMGPTKELITGDKPNTESSKLHQLILNNSQRLLSLVNQLLDFRKSVHQGMKLKVTQTDLVEIIESNIAAFAYVSNEKHIQVDFKTSEKKLEGWYDLEKLDIILFNILSNAFKYTPDYGFVSLVLAASEANQNLETKHVEIKISNTGKGIPQHLQDKVFERFYQVVDSTNKTNVGTGTGIGLALVRNMVELHHGKIMLESIADKTTTFTVYLPIEKEAYSNEEIFDFARDADRRTKELIKTVDTRNEESVYDKKDSKQHKILIVEDNQELREYLSGFLSSDYKVYTANDGKEGLLRCKEKHPNLIISDVMMDNMDGLQFCKELKSNPEISHIPVILMTAMASVENKLQGYKTGADDYITKPFEPELLKIRVKNILQNISKIKQEFAQNPEIPSKELTVSKIDEEFLNQAIDLVTQNLDNENFDIDGFSKNLGVSSSQLYRKIKAVSGVSPNEFVRTFRLRQAAKMIQETQLSLSEIAYKVGFNDSLYFSKCFKKQFGVAPSKYLYPKS